MADSPVKKLHHVAVAVESVSASLGFYSEVLGLEVTRIMTLKERGLKVALIQAGDTEIELLEPISDENTVKRFLERRGSGLHHICFQVDDIEAAMKELKARGAEFIEDVPREGAVGLVSFMPPAVADGVLVELAQLPGGQEHGDGAQEHATSDPPSASDSPTVSDSKDPVIMPTRAADTTPSPPSPTASDPSSEGR